MRTLQNIVILHPAAIGDVMLATPVASSLRANYPQAKITYWSHGELLELLGLAKAVDNCIPFNKDTNILKQLSVLSKLKPDLLIDLSSSSRLWWLSFSGVALLKYRKNPAGSPPEQHAVDNFLATISVLKPKPMASMFPTLTIRQADICSVREKLDLPARDSRRLVALVPAVGHLRPHRAWLPERWLSLGHELLSSGKYLPVLIGGRQETALCAELGSKLNCLNAAGRLTLVETATLLKLCRAAVAGDTGPAHIAVAVGTPVVGLYGPTYPERSGPYGYMDLVVSASHYCRCHKSKHCSLIKTAGPGECMRQITLEEVLAKLRLTLQDKHFPESFQEVKI